MSLSVFYIFDLFELLFLCCFYVWSIASGTAQICHRDKKYKSIKDWDYGSTIFSFSKSKYIDDIQFVPYKNTSSLFDYIIRVIDKLEYMWEDGRREEAEETGKEMIRILQAVETDDDQFPEYEISLIENIIYPYGQS